MKPITLKALQKRAQDYGIEAALSHSKFPSYSGRLDTILQWLPLDPSVKNHIKGSFYRGFAEECAKRGLKQDFVDFEAVEFLHPVE